MQQQFSFISSLIFFLVYYFYDLYTASLCLSVFSAVQLVTSLALSIEISRFEKINLASIAGFGLLTWWFQDARYIQWKITLIHGCMALGIILYRSFNQRDLSSTLLATQQINIPEYLAKKIDQTTVIFLCFIALLNIAVFRLCSMNTWVLFKGSLVIINSLYLIAIIYSVRGYLPESTASKHGST